MSHKLDVKIINSQGGDFDTYYTDAVYEDFTMYLPFPDLDKKNILEDIKYVILHIEKDYDIYDTDKWFICVIVDSCVTNYTNDTNYDKKYNKLKGDYTGEFHISDILDKPFYIGVGVDIVAEIEIDENDLDILH